MTHPFDAAIAELRAADQAWKVAADAVTAAKADSGTLKRGQSLRAATAARESAAQEAAKNLAGLLIDQLASPSEVSRHLHWRLVERVYEDELVVPEPPFDDRLLRLALEQALQGVSTARSEVDDHIADVAGRLYDIEGFDQAVQALSKASMHAGQAIWRVLRSLFDKPESARWVVEHIGLAAYREATSEGEARAQGSDE